MSNNTSFAFLFNMLLDKGSWQTDKLIWLTTVASEEGLMFGTCNGVELLSNSISYKEKQK